jgi:hypothetical protein
LHLTLQTLEFCQNLRATDAKAVAHRRSKSGARSSRSRRSESCCSFTHGTHIAPGRGAGGARHWDSSPAGARHGASVGAPSLGAASFGAPSTSSLLHPLAPSSLLHAHRHRQKEVSHQHHSTTRHDSRVSLQETSAQRDMTHVCHYKRHQPTVVTGVAHGSGRDVKFI